MKAKPRVAFVVQRCGLEVNGGAESHCLQMAQRMSPWWDTEVLTTCALDYVTWRNHFPPGEEACAGTIIRRFSADRERNNEAFNELSARLHEKQRRCSMAEQRAWMHAQGPNAPALTDYIRQNRDAYDAFIFFGYLYATTFDNLPLVADKAWLAPLAHDEWPLNFTAYDRLFALPQGILFNTVTEQALLRERFFHLRLTGPVAGVGIEPPPNIDANRFRLKHGLEGPFLLYCGRIDPSKGCPEMFEAFLAWKKKHLLPHRLVLIGKSVMPVPDHPDILPLGFVPDAEKWDAMAACDWLLMPSIYESLSMVLLETWAVGRPAIVNARCQVLADHCAISHGGIAFESWEEALGSIRVVSGPEARQLGENGRHYVARHYSWDKVCAEYLTLLTPADHARARSRASGNAR